MSDTDGTKKSFDKEGLRNVLVVAFSVCLVCSIVVSTAAVALKPQQQANKILDHYHEGHKSACKISDLRIEIERPDYAPGVSQPSSYHHRNHRNGQIQGFPHSHPSF